MQKLLIVAPAPSPHSLYWFHGQMQVGSHHGALEPTIVLKTKQKTRGSSAFSASPGHFCHKGVNINSSLGVASSCILLSEAQTCRSHILS